MAKELWVEKYRPKNITEYVFVDAAQKRQVKTWIKEKSIPHLLLGGAAGIGKTTLAKVLLNELEVPDYDILHINASRDNSTETVRDKIYNFVQMIPFGPFKAVLLDEADYLSPNAQAALRGVMETYSSTSRFILTCNYPNRIIPAIHSRCQTFNVTKTDQVECFKRVEHILKNESVLFDEEILAHFIAAYYPDLRKTINAVQQNVQDGTLRLPTADSDSSDYKIEMVELFKKGRIQDARKLLCGRIRPEEIDEVYTWMYQNLDLFGDTEEQKDSAVLIIKQGLVDHALIADPEINLAAVLIKLARL